MASDRILHVQNVSKKFCRSLKRSLAYGMRDILSELACSDRNGGDLRKGEFWALQNVNLELRKGEALGLVGPNGSGKTTLLRIISGLLKPDTGRVEVRGLLAPLIALGAGFNPVLTGRENLFANMAILGMPRNEIRKRFDEVVDFAEVGDAIDAPVRTYSSGMAARLGFASAIFTKPDILLIDEVLAVGDIRFRAKCTRHLASLREKGVSFIVVSHNSYTLLTMTDMAVYLNRGETGAFGPTQEIVQRYEQDISGTEQVNVPGRIDLPEKHHSESTGLDIRSISWRDRDGSQLATPVSGYPASLRVDCLARYDVGAVDLCVQVLEAGVEQRPVLHLTNKADEVPLTISAGDCGLSLDLPTIGLKPGKYAAKVTLRSFSYELLDVYTGFQFNVVAGNGESYFRNEFHQPRSWSCTRAGKAADKGGQSQGVQHHD